MQQKKIISEESASQYQNWQAPAVEGSIASPNSIYKKPPTLQDIEELQKQAYAEAKAEGYKKGFEQGHGEAQQALQQEFQQKLNLLDSYLNLINQPLHHLNEQMEQEIVNLSLLFARQIIRRELKVDPGEIVAVVREAIKAVPASSENVRFCLHPEDAELVRNAFSINEEELNWKIEEDILLMRGDCRVETNASLIDASVESRLSAIAAKMLGGDRDSDT